MKQRINPYQIGTTHHFSTLMTTKRNILSTVLSKVNQKIAEKTAEQRREQEREAERRSLDEMRQRRNQEESMNVYRNNQPETHPILQKICLRK